jgi:hypothetical protein
MDLKSVIQIFSKLLLVLDKTSRFSIADRIIAGQIEMLCEIFDFFPATKLYFQV